MKGIDVSEHNGIIDWNKVKSQIDFAIIRVSYGMHKIDKMAIRNIEECIRLQEKLEEIFKEFTREIKKENVMDKHINEFKE